MENGSVVVVVVERWMDGWERGRFGFRAGFVVVQER